MTELSQRRARLVQRLRRRRSREREGRVLVEGVRAATEALDAGASVEFAVVSPRMASSEEGHALLARLEAGADVLSTSDVALEALADTEHPQGVLLVCAEPESTLDGLAGRGAHDAGRPRGGGAREPGRGRILVLDAVQDPGNVGTLVRSAVAFGLDGVVCLDGTADAWSAKTVRASAGMLFRVPVVRARAEEALGWMRERRIAIVVAAADGLAADGWRASFDGEDVAGLALVVGNEGAGVRPELREAAHATLAVAMCGPADSLNVGIAGSILMHELTKQRP
jgi:RNA methyltransferase, TrmH family